MTKLTTLTLLATFVLGCSKDPQISPQAPPFFMEGDTVLINGEGKGGVIREIDLGVDGTWQYQVGTARYSESQISYPEELQ